MPNFSLNDAVFTEAAKRFPTPFYLYDERGIRQAARRINAAFAFAPAFKEYFAVKALPNPQILKILLEEGCGLDCSSLTELLLAERLGVRGEGIMFSANAMPPSEMRKARELQALINLDDQSDVEILDQNGGIPECVCLRINPGGNFGSSNRIMGTPGDAKYGWMPEQALPGLLKMKALGLKRFGLHAMLASNMLSPDYYPTQARYLFTLGAELEAKSGLKLDFINLSGGIGIPYKPGDQAVDLEQVSKRIQAIDEEVFGLHSSVKLKTELGRFLTGPSGFLVTRAVHRKDIHKTYIGLDACAANLMRPAMYGAYHEISVVGKREAPKTECYDLTGCLCENNDKFAIDRRMPPINPGDLLFIHDVGAHGYSMGYQYNGRLRGAEILYGEDGQYRLIRRAETPEDYFATLV